MNPTLYRVRSCAALGALLAVLAALGATMKGHAANVVWENTGSTWSTGGNWVGGNAPTNDTTTDIAVFNAAASRVNPDFTRNRGVAGITINNSLGSYNIEDPGKTNRLRLGASGIAITGGTTLIDPNVELHADQTWSGTGNLTLNGVLTNFDGDRTLTNSLSGSTLTIAGSVDLSNDNTGRTFTIAGSGSTLITGAIGNGGSGSGNLIKDGAGTLTLTGVSTYTGTTWIRNGTLALVTGANDDDRLPTGTILRIDAPGIFDMRDSSQTLGGLQGAGGVVNATAVGGLAEVLTLNVTTGTPLVFDGVIGNGGDGVSLVKSGAGTQVLAGAGSSYSGGTTVTGGTLLFSNTAGSGAGSGAVTVSGSGTTVGGTGSFTGALTLGSGTRLAPGDPVQGNQAGTLSTGAVTMNNGSFFDIDIGGTTAGDGGAGFYDRLAVTGGATVAGTLTVNLFGGFTPTNGQQFTIVTSTGTRSGTFNGLANGAVFTQSGQSWLINYFANSVVLTAVPEPGVLALLGVGALGFAAVSWRRKKTAGRL